MQKRPRDAQRWSVQQYLDYLDDYVYDYYYNKSDIFWLDQIIGLEQAQVGYQMLGSTLDFSTLTPEMIPGNIEPGTELYMFRAPPSNPANIPLYLACYPTTSDKIWELWVNGTMHLNLQTGEITFLDSTKVLTMELVTSGTPSGTITWDPDFVAAHADKKYTFTEFTTYPELQTFASVSKNFPSAFLNNIALTSGNDRLGVDCEFLHGQIGTISDILGELDQTVQEIPVSNILSRLTALEGYYGQMEGQISDLQTNQAIFIQNIGDLQQEVITVQGEVSALDTRLGTVETAITALQTAVAGIPALETAVTDLQTAVTAMQAKLPRILTQAEITTAYDEIPAGCDTGSIGCCPSAPSMVIGFGGTNPFDGQFVLCQTYFAANNGISPNSNCLVSMQNRDDGMKTITAISSNDTDNITPNDIQGSAFVSVAAGDVKYIWVRVYPFVNAYNIPFLQFLTHLNNDLAELDSKIDEEVARIDSKIPDLPDDVDENLPYVLTAENETE